jgi:MFS family permease
MLARMSDAPPVVTWYRVYAGLMAAMYLLVLVGGVTVPLWAPPEELEDDPPPWAVASIVGCVSLPFAAAFLAAFFLPVKPWAWIYHLVLICVGFTSACCIVASVPLLIFWIKPETKAYFGHA